MFVIYARVRRGSERELHPILSRKQSRIIGVTEKVITMVEASDPYRRFPFDQLSSLSAYRAHLNSGIDSNLIYPIDRTLDV